MPATVSAIQRTDKKRKDNTCPIYIRVTSNRVSRFIGTKIYIEERLWNKRTRRVRSTHDLADAYNARISAMLNEAREAGLAAVSADVVKRALQKGSGSVINDLDEYVEELTIRSQEWERRHFMVLREKIIQSLGPNLTWEQLSKRMLVRFEQYLREERGNANNTIRNEMKRLHRLFRRALAQGTVRTDQDPFLSYKRPKAIIPNKRRLKTEEIEALRQLSLPEAVPVRIARDAFLFSYYGGGVRFGDLCMLTPDNIVDERLVYRMMKTTHPVSIKLPSVALDLIESYRVTAHPYIFPFIERHHAKDEALVRRRISSRNVIVNRNLKKAAELAEIAPEGLTMHVARHSFADIARTRSGDLHAISKALGHSDLKTTEMYLNSFDQDSVDELTGAMWGREN
jgi:site-specific recombinase XerD